METAIIGYSKQTEAAKMVMVMIKQDHLMMNTIMDVITCDVINQCGIPFRLILSVHYLTMFCMGEMFDILMTALMVMLSICWEKKTQPHWCLE